MNRKRKRLIITGAAVIILIVIVVVNLKGGSKIDVEAHKVLTGKIESVVSAPGKIHAVKEVNVSSDIMGKLVKLNVEEGDWVEKGELIAKLDSTEEYASYRRAISNVGANKADLEFKKEQFSRKQKLYQKGLISKENYDNIATALEVARLNLENARTELKRAKKRLEKTTIRAPISGTVMNVNVEEGENVITGTMNNPGTVLLTISNLDAMEMVADVNESELPLIELYDTAEVSIEAFQDTVFRGYVRNIASMPKTSITTSSGAVEFEVKINLPHHPGMLPGMSATTEIITDVENDVMRIPLQAIVTKEEKKGVYRIEKGKVKFVETETGISGGRWIEIEEGLEKGDLIVTGPLKVLMKLNENQEVTWEVENEKDKEKQELEEKEKKSEDEEKRGKEKNKGV